VGPVSARRTGRGPAGPRRPGGRATGRAATRTRTTAAPAAGEATRRRPRLTGRAAVLVLVLAVLAVSYASSLKAFLEQRAHISDVKADIARTSAEIDQLEREKRRWQDDAFVRIQARERFGYVMPGETAYVVLDEKGKPVESRAELHDPDEILAEPPMAWWDDAWASVELAGHPPKHQPPPATDLEAPKD
jgi:cell division protein FtsB